MPDETIHRVTAANPLLLTTCNAKGYFMNSDDLVFIDTASIGVHKTSSSSKSY